jgi:RNA polymerase sigma-70 factor (ECF subfamily)
VARDAARRSRHRAISMPDGEPVAAAPSPDAVCARREIAQLGASAVAALPEPLRLVLVLRHYEDMSFEDIARLTGTPASTLKSRFAAALNQLRIRLRNLDFTPKDHEP